MVIGIKDKKRLGEVLDRFYRDYGLKSRIKADPIEFPHRYDDPKDTEIAGFIASSLAYGRIDLFKPVIGKILNLADRSPYEFVINFDPRKERGLFKGIKYRMNKEGDIACLVYFIGEALRDYGSLGSLFSSFYNEDDEDIRKALIGFVDYFLSLDPTPVYGKKGYPFGLLQFFPSPVKGSPCKRLNMYLRWMVRRDDGVDFGLWKNISPSKLIIPIDTHIGRMCRNLGLTTRKNTSWQMAKEITENLKQFDPDDPVKYDFALCHLGISGECPARKNKENCSACSLEEICRREG